MAQPDNCPNELNYSLGNLKLSPNKTSLAWLETFTWCPNTSCFGLNRIMAYDLATGESQILVELPIHIDATTTQILGGVVWSPNSQAIAFSISSRTKGWSFIRTVDIKTKQVQEISEGLNPVAWSQDNNLIAVTTNTSQEQKWAIEIFDTTGQFVATFGNWDLVERIDWSSNASKLAVTVLANYQDTGSSASSLFIIDLDLAEMREVDIVPENHVAYDEPHWSPDGQLLGVNVSETQLDKSLIVFDPENREIKANISPEIAFDRWSWASDGSSILMLMGGDSVFHPFTPQEIGIFHWETEELTKIILPSQLVEELKNREALLGNPVW